VSREKVMSKAKKGLRLRRGSGRLSWKEKRGSRRLAQIRAQMNADFLIREWLEVW
jgi:hypothetical protein